MSIKILSVERGPAQSELGGDNQDELGNISANPPVFGERPTAAKR